MSISNTVKTVMPYLKTAGEYVLHKLSSQAVEMNDGTTLEQKVTSLISLINQKLNVSKVINNLLTTEAGFALDARQGKVLNDKITKLNGDLSTHTSITAISSGFTWNMSLTRKYVVAYKIGRIVYLYAYFQNSNGITTNNTEVKVFTLPSSLTPITSYVPCAVHGSTSLETRMNCIIHQDDRAIYIYTPGSATAGQAYIHISAMYIATT